MGSRPTRNPPPPPRARESIAGRLQTPRWVCQGTFGEGASHPVKTVREKTAGPRAQGR